MTLAMPPALVPGDVVGVAAPSGPLDRQHLWTGLAWVRTRYRIVVSPGILARTGHLAGQDSRRLSELGSALVDRSTKAVLLARGGYGAMRIAEAAFTEEFARRPKWIAGFSDVTVLHAMAWRMGVASIHGPNVTGLARRRTPARVRASWIGALERPGATRVWSGLRALGAAGTGCGLIVGGNLSVLHALAAAGRLWIPQGAVLALEDVNEPPYRIDRMLTSLLLGGFLARACAIVFGGFDHCHGDKDGPTALDVLEERTRSLGIPVVAGAPFGHGERNDSFVLGGRAEVSGDSVRLGD